MHSIEWSENLKKRDHLEDLRHVKEPYKYDRCSSAKFRGHFSHVFLSFAARVSGSYC
jgi:hypothetical protein